MTGSLLLVPPADYWIALATRASAPQVARLRELSDRRVNEFSPSDLPPPEADAIALLDRVAADGWIEVITRKRCPNCDVTLSDEEAARAACPNCDEDFGQRGGVKVERVYTRRLAPQRVVDWVIAIHGMNTSGAWQESFSWHLATTWGRSVPVAIYKYGIIIAGVIMRFRRRGLQRNLREKIATLRREAESRGFNGKPDVVAHSFGTWLFGHLLRDELQRDPNDRLDFGRVILTGCILRPDYDWQAVKDAGLVDDVMNHYGTADRVVPLAHATIWDSGPSGRRGFDGPHVLNVRAAGFGHSDLFDLAHLDRTYSTWWRPFLTLPREELQTLPDRVDPITVWTQRRWPFRATLLPWRVLVLLVLLLLSWM